jgi:acyl-CoA thioesterase-1
MSAILFLFGSGWAFFLGVAMILGGFVGRIRTARKWIDRVSLGCVEIGLAIVVLSAAPLPYWLYLAAVGATIAWLLREKAERTRQPSGNRRLAAIRAALLGAWVLAIFLELPYHFPTKLWVRGGEDVYVIGDSVTAGVGDRIVTWPNLLSERTSFVIHDFSQAGAKSKSAMSQAEKLPSVADVVVLEIGGNDLLGTTTSPQFAQDLEALLAYVCERSDNVLMFELPLPPLCNEYGRIQRRLAARHGVRLVPKWQFMRVLAQPDSTSDSIHLSQPGQNRMAHVVASVLAVK